MISIRHLTKRYGTTKVLEDVNLDIPTGEAVALWGHNGAGKTTIVRAILSLIHHEGSITVDGLDTTKQGTAVRRRIGHVPQELSFMDDLTVAETLEFSASLKGADPAGATSILDTVGLGDETAKRVGALSGGMKQRLAIGLALLGDPPILLLDEPTSNLDAATREAMVGLLDGLRGADRTIVLTSHNLGEVGLLADRVVTLEHGVVVDECDPTQLGERLGLAVRIHVTIRLEDATRALALLEEAGHAARQNGTGLVVESPAGRKGGAIATLTRHDIEVLDFEVWR